MLFSPPFNLRSPFRDYLTFFKANTKHPSLKNRIVLMFVSLPLPIVHDTWHHPHNLLIISNIGLSEDATKTSTTVDTIIAMQNHKILSAWHMTLASFIFFYHYHLKRTAGKKGFRNVPRVSNLLAGSLPTRSSQFYYNSQKWLSRKTINMNVNKSEDRDQTKCY